MYAIIDIETTGGSADRSRITEIAILLHDGTKVVDEFVSLINPECSIPANITQLTGISNEMVRDAPPFYAVAKQIIELTKDATFVAHNVRFDYSFVKAAFKDLGYNYQRKTLCTVRLSRSTFPGLDSYSLGNLCNSLSIPLQNRHRAMGDARATALLFDRILASGKMPLGKDDDWLSLQTKKTNYPPLLAENALQAILPDITGVYYFLNSAGKIIYVGKSNDIRKRIGQHFLSLKTKKALRLHQEIATITYEETGSELVALLLESDEIKKWKPLFNTAQKRSRAIPYFGLYSFIDEQGYIQLKLAPYQEDEAALLTFDQLVAAKTQLTNLVSTYQLCLSKCDLHAFKGPCFNRQIKKCMGACMGEESATAYNARVEAAIQKFSFQEKSFLLIDKGRTTTEKAIICVEKGIYKGFGYYDTDLGNPNLETMRDSIKAYPHNKDIQKILSHFVGKRKQISY